MAEGTRLGTFCALLRNLILASLLYIVIFGATEFFSSRSPKVVGRLGIPAWMDKNVPPTDILKTTKSGAVKVKFAGSSSVVTIEPHANVFNRPISSVRAKDDYLGPRPHVDTEANLQMMVEECRGTYEGLEKMRNVFACAHFFATNESQYYYLPQKEDRASSQDPRKAEYQNADGFNNSVTAYISSSKARPYSKSTSGDCAGPIIPYHVYWSGPATWRVEIFIKSYLYTQNLACSRLHLWVDADRNSHAVEHMLVKDPLFARFLPFVERGDIIVREWKFPRRMPMPEGLGPADGVEYYKNPGKPNSKGETTVADGIIEDQDGQKWLTLTPKQMTFFPQAISDAVRFVILHIYGGIYLDMDVLPLRDMRPLILPQNHSFAERWGGHSFPGDYNTAVLSLRANSSLSSYLLRGGVRMGLNFHPRVIGRMAMKDGRDRELLMMETAAFDPIWTEFNWDRAGRCTLPCLHDYGAVFRGKSPPPKDEWESFDGEPLEAIERDADGVADTNVEMRGRSVHVARRYMRWGKQHRNAERTNDSTATEETLDLTEHAATETSTGAHSPSSSADSEPDSFASTPSEEEELRKQGVIAEYRYEEDKYPPTNRTLENFFRGAWSYHIHNQWNKHPEPSSWIDVMQHAHDGFFAGNRTNMYGEDWDGPALMPYNFWPEFV